MKRILFVRHGSTASNPNGVLRGWSDDPLSALGQRQAERTADYLATLPPVDHIYTSTLLRSSQTGDVLSRRLGVPCEARDDLRELNIGTLDGRTEAELWEYFVQQSGAEHGLGGMREVVFPGGESVSAFLSRVLAALAEIGARHPGGTPPPSAAAPEGPLESPPPGGTGLPTAGAPAGHLRNPIPGDTGTQAASAPVGRAESSPPGGAQPPARASVARPGGSPPPGGMRPHAASATPDGSVLVVSHGVLTMVALGLWLEPELTRWPRFRVANCSISEVAFEPAPRLVRLNETAHLSDADAS